MSNIDNTSNTRNTCNIRHIGNMRTKKQVLWVPCIYQTAAQVMNHLAYLVTRFEHLITMRETTHQLYSRQESVAGLSEKTAKWKDKD